MASDETMNMYSSTHEDEDVDENHHHNLSRLSICSNQSMYENFDEEDDMKMYMSRLSIEGSEGGYGDDEAFSDGKDDHQIINNKGLLVSILSSDSDEVLPGCFSLPATPPRRRRTRNWGCFNLPILAMDDDHMKEYVSENEASKGVSNKLSRNSRRKVTREKWLEKAWEKKKKKEIVQMVMNHEDLMMREEEIEEEHKYINHQRFNGEGECLLITRPNGGRRSLCMDIEEVKACRDLGFELEHERMEIPSRISVSGSTIDTSSGGNSPSGNWRISSPGDDPKDVKARLKVWAQAVALASASRLVS